jgi:hypothetical protein
MTERPRECQRKGPTIYLIDDADHFRLGQRSHREDPFRVKRSLGDLADGNRAPGVGRLGGGR